MTQLSAFVAKPWPNAPLAVGTAYKTLLVTRAIHINEQVHRLIHKTGCSAPSSLKFRVNAEGKYVILSSFIVDTCKCLDSEVAVAEQIGKH